MGNESLLIHRQKVYKTSSTTVEEREDVLCQEILQLVHWKSAAPLGSNPYYV